MCNERKMDTPDRQQHITDDAGGPISYHSNLLLRNSRNSGYLARQTNHRRVFRHTSGENRRSSFVSQIKVRFLWGIPRGVMSGQVQRSPLSCFVCVWQTCRSHSLRNSYRATLTHNFLLSCLLGTWICCLVTDHSVSERSKASYSIFF